MDIFGEMPNCDPVGAVEIAGGGLKATILSYGSLLYDLRLKGHDAPLVLAYADFADYLEHSPYLGANAGRSINRIRDGLLTIDGVTHQLEQNFLGKHNLHGGSNGIGTRNWRFAAVSKDEAVLEIRCPDGNMGFPGNLDVRATYRLSGKGVLSVELEAVTDKPTICNLAHHSYFNLEDGGRTSILDHFLQINAEAYTPVDEALIPDGCVLPVAGTDFDFRKLRPVRRERGGIQVIYDCNYCLTSARSNAMRLAATAKAPGSGVTMECFTGEPGIQFYAGNTMARPALSPGGYAYQAYSGFCLETQVWPNSPSLPYFPQTILRPGDLSRQVTEYRFSR
jgi:aldose 1-epimerase